MQLGRTLQPENYRVTLAIHFPRKWWYNPYLCSKTGWCTRIVQRWSCWQRGHSGKAWRLWWWRSFKFSCCCHCKSLLAKSSCLCRTRQFVGRKKTWSWRLELRYSLIPSSPLWSKHLWKDTKNSKRWSLDHLCYCSWRRRARFLWLRSRSCLSLGFHKCRLVLETPLLSLVLHPQRACFRILWEILCSRQGVQTCLRSTSCLPGLWVWHRSYTPCARRCQLVQLHALQTMAP